MSRKIEIVLVLCVATAICLLVQTFSQSSQVSQVGLHTNNLAAFVASQNDGIDVVVRRFPHYWSDRGLLPVSFDAATSSGDPFVSHSIAGFGVEGFHNPGAAQFAVRVPTLAVAMLFLIYPLFVLRGAFHRERRLHVLAGTFKNENDCEMSESRYWQVLSKLADLESCGKIPLCVSHEPSRRNLPEFPGR